MMRPWLLVSVLVVAGAAAAAFDRAHAARVAGRARDEAHARLDQARALSDQHPHAFGSALSAAEQGGALKTQAQEAATSRGVTIGYLSETERETRKGGREMQVVVRLVEAPHGGLVRFLQDLETAGGRVKELHLRPSRSTPDAYEEAEIVLARQEQAP